MPDNPTLEVTPEVVQADGKNRIANTAGQVGVAGAVVIVSVWIARQIGWDGDMPLEVSTSIQGLLTAAAAWWSNRRKLRGEI